MLQRFQTSEAPQALLSTSHTSAGADVQHSFSDVETRTFTRVFLHNIFVVWFLPYLLVPLQCLTGIDSLLVLVCYITYGALPELWMLLQFPKISSQSGAVIVPSGRNFLLQRVPGVERDCCMSFICRMWRFGWDVLLPAVLGAANRADGFTDVNFVMLAMWVKPVSLQSFEHLKGKVQSILKHLGLEHTMLELIPRWFPTNAGTCALITLLIATLFQVRHIFAYLKDLVTMFTGEAPKQYIHCEPVTIDIDGELVPPNDFKAEDTSSKSETAWKLRLKNFSDEAGREMVIDLDDEINAVFAANFNKQGFNPDVARWRCFAIVDIENTTCLMRRFPGFSGKHAEDEESLPAITSVQRQITSITFSPTPVDPPEAAFVFARNRILPKTADGLPEAKYAVCELGVLVKYLCTFPRRQIDDKTVFNRTINEQKEELTASKTFSENLTQAVIQLNYLAAILHSGKGLSSPPVLTVLRSVGIGVVASVFTILLAAKDAGDILQGLSKAVMFIGALLFVAPSIFEHEMTGNLEHLLDDLNLQKEHLEKLEQIGAVLVICSGSLFFRCKFSWRRSGGILGYVAMASLSGWLYFGGGRTLATPFDLIMIGLGIYLLILLSSTVLAPATLFFIFETWGFAALGGGCYWIVAAVVFIAPSMLIKLFSKSAADLLWSWAFCGWGLIYWSLFPLVAKLWCSLVLLAVCFAVPFILSLVLHCVLFIPIFCVCIVYGFIATLRHPDADTQAIIRRALALLPTWTRGTDDEDNLPKGKPYIEVAQVVESSESEKKVETSGFYPLLIFTGLLSWPIVVYFAWGPLGDSCHYLQMHFLSWTIVSLLSSLWFAGVFSVVNA